MLFNSHIFIFAFLPFTWLIYFYLNKSRLTEMAKAFLLLASLFFYGWWNIKFLPIILLSILFNYAVGVSLTNNKEKHKISDRLLLSVGMVFNVSLLAYFKYVDFFIENINNVLGSEIGQLHLILPLAISFFTFQQIAYLVDSYKRKTRETNFLNYAVFIAFFPQLIAGPIVHHQDMMPQFSSLKNKIVNYKNVILGLIIFSIGLFKKVVLADSFAIIANNGFSHADMLNFYQAWITSFSYTFQLYFDFSGYVDMAIGAALLFNIKLPLNFNSPYKAVNIQDFWRRWHITLSSFLRNYIYIPLGGNRRGKNAMYLNIIATFIIGGVWHGAGWTFIFWGLLHGLALVAYHIWSQLQFKMNTVVAQVVTLLFVNITWVFFRAEEWHDAISILKSMFQVENLGLVFTPELLFILSGFVITSLFINSNQIISLLRSRNRINKRIILSFSLLFAVALIFVQNGSVFLYYEF